MRKKRHPYRKRDGRTMSMPTNGHSYWMCDCGELNPDNKHKCGSCGGNRPDDSVTTRLRDLG